MEQMERKSPLSDLMRTAMEKVHEMVDTKSIVGEPIVTADGVTLIPISRVSVGFGSGGGDASRHSQRMRRRDARKRKAFSRRAVEGDAAEKRIHIHHKRAADVAECRQTGPEDEVRGR